MNTKNQKKISKSSHSKRETSATKGTNTEPAKPTSQTKNQSKRAESKKISQEKAKKQSTSKSINTKKNSPSTKAQKKAVKGKSEVDSESQIISKKSLNVAPLKAAKGSKEKQTKHVSTKNQKEEESRSSKLERSRDKSQIKKKQGKSKYKEAVVPTKTFGSKDSNESNSENSARKNSVSQSSSQAKPSFGSHSGSNSKEKEDSYKQEIKKMIKKVEDSKKNKEKAKFIGKKRDRSTGTSKHITAKDYDYILQKNPNFKREHLIDVNSLAKRQIITPSEIVLSLVEIAHNQDYYQLSYKNKSKTFWEDVLNYKLLGKIFNGLKSETLRKYWRILSKYDHSKIKFVVEKNKKFFDSMNIKILTILTALSKHFENKIDDIEKYVRAQIVDIRKEAIYQEVVKNDATGEVVEERDVRTTTSKRRRYEPGHKRQFVQRNPMDKELLDDIYSSGSKKSSKFQQLIKGLNQEKSVQLKFLKSLSEKEKKKILNINEDDKFAFKVIDLVLDALEKEFKNISRDYILDTLISNSMYLIQTYQCLNDEDEHLGFTSADDKVILKMKGKKNYAKLIKEKGEKRVLEREEFLKH